LSKNYLDLPNEVGDGYSKISLRKLANMVIGSRIATLILIIVVIYLIGINFSEHLGTIDNLLVMIMGFSNYVFISIGMTIVIVAGGFDLSVGSVLALSAVITGMVVGESRMSYALAILAGLLTGASVGALNGTLINRFKINPLIATLGMMYLVRGIALIVTRGYPIVGIPIGFQKLGQGTIAGIQIPIIVMIILVVIFSILVAKTRFFRQLYFVGDNEQAAHLTGMNVSRLRFFTYVIVGLFSGLAGVFHVARLGSAQPSAGGGTELWVIASVIIGGGRMGGGRGTVLGTFLALFFMGLITNTLNMLGVSIYLQQAVIGLLLLGAIIIEPKRQR